MQQSNIIFGSLTIAFILYITNKGELGTYLTFFRGGGTQTPLASGSGSGSSGALGNLGSLGNSITGSNGTTDTGAGSNPLDIVSGQVSGETNPLDIFSSGSF